MTVFATAPVSLPWRLSNTWMSMSLPAWMAPICGSSVVGSSRSTTVMSSTMFTPACALMLNTRSCVPLMSMYWLSTSCSTTGMRGVKPCSVPIEPFGASSCAMFVRTTFDESGKRMLPRSFLTSVVPIGLSIVPSRYTSEFATVFGWMFSIFTIVGGIVCLRSNSNVARFAGSSDSETSFPGVSVGPGMLSTVTLILVLPARSITSISCVTRSRSE